MLTFSFNISLSDLNLLDWSANNHVALSLNNSVYLWNAGNGSITQLLELENPDEYVSSVSWIKEGNILAVGNSIGCVQVPFFLLISHGTFHH